jgi:hypothetical protein
VSRQRIKGTERPPTGPYGSPEEAMAEPMPRQVQALHDAGRVESGDPAGVAWDTRRAALIVAIVEAGVKLGNFDRQVIDWLTRWEPATVQVVIGLIGRAHAAGRAAATTSEPADRTFPPPPASSAPDGGDTAAQALTADLEISADLATDLRNEARTPTELAAVELLIGVDLHRHPAVVRRVITVGTVAVDWHQLAADLDAGDVREVTTDQQYIVLPLACSLGAGVGVSLSTVLAAIRSRPDGGERYALTRLVLAAVRTALCGGGLR